MILNYDEALARPADVPAGECDCCGSTAALWEVEALTYRVDPVRRGFYCEACLRTGAYHHHNVETRSVLVALAWSHNRILAEIRAGREEKVTWPTR